MGFELANIHGQGYDGAANMSSNRVGLQVIVREKAPLATCTHCAGHCLNLVIGHSCGLGVVRNVIDKMKAICLYFHNSPKRNKLLQEIVSKNIPQASKRSPILDLCKTRWAARHLAYQHFYQSFKYIVMAFEAIAFGSHQDILSGDFANASWDAESQDQGHVLFECHYGI